MSNRSNQLRVAGPSALLGRLASATLGLALAWGPTVGKAAPSEEQMTAPLGTEGRRGPPPPRLRAPADKRLPDLETPAGLGETASSLGLIRRDDGSYLYVDPSQRFRLLIRPDGRVLFADRWKKPDNEDAQHGRCCGAPAEGVLVAINPFFGVPMPGPLEWAMKSRGLDPRVRAKADVLEATAEFRTKLAVAWYRDNLRHRLRDLRHELDRVWTDDARSLSRRKTILFERWDEGEDRLGESRVGLPPDAIPQIDEERRRAADRARTIIVDFIRKHLPADSSLAFTDEELDRFNARRRSVTRFAPYAQRTP